MVPNVMIATSLLVALLAWLMWMARVAATEEDLDSRGCVCLERYVQRTALVPATWPRRICICAAILSVALLIANVVHRVAG